MSFTEVQGICTLSTRGYLPFKRSQGMAERGDLPSRLLKCKFRSAQHACRKAYRRPCRSRAPFNAFSVPPATAPGHVVGIDQLISPTPGLTGQMKGCLTHKRYTVTPVFVDYYSGTSNRRLIRRKLLKPRKHLIVSQQLIGSRSSATTPTMATLLIRLLSMRSMRKGKPSLILCF